MVINILVYLIVVLLTVVCLCIYTGSFICLILAFEIVYFVLGIIQVILVKFSTNIKMDCMSPISECRKPVKILVKTRAANNWIFGRYKAKVIIYNRFEKRKKVVKISGKTVNGSVKYLQFTPTRCGKYEIKIEKLYLLDMLGIFKVKKKIHDYLEIGVLPSTNLMPIEISRKTREYIADAEEYSTREAGDDPSELYQIREYKEGDSLHDIHWKISAKEETLMVKERSKPIGAPVLIKLDLSKEKSDTKLFSLNKNIVKDDILSIVASIVFTLYDSKCICMVAWYEPDSLRVKKMKVRNETDVYNLLNRVLYIKSYKSDDYIKDITKEAFRGTEFSTVIEVDLDGKVQVNGQLVEVPKINKRKNDIDWSKFIITV